VVQITRNKSQTASMVFVIHKFGLYVSSAMHNFQWSESRPHRSKVSPSDVVLVDIGFVNKLMQVLVRFFRARQWVGLVLGSVGGWRTISLGLA
jgi:hypothetical protein